MKQPSASGDDSKSKTGSSQGIPIVRRTPSLVTRHGDKLTALLFLLPSLLVFGIFFYYGIIYNFYVSLTSWNFINPIKKFVGFDNYKEFAASGDFRIVAQNTAYYSASTVLIALVLGLGLALLLNRNVRARGLMRTIFFAPFVTTLSAAAMLWLWMYEPEYGLVNVVLGWIGIRGPEWMRSTQWAMPGLIIMNVWRTVGYNMVIYLAALQSIPEELIESADMDGATPLQSLRHLTLPLLSPTTFFLIVVGVIASFKIFTAVAVMTAGGPLESTQVFTHYIYERSFQYFQAGYGAAVATVFFVILLILTTLQLRLQRYWVHY